jgi:ribosome modulation factor
MASAGRFGCLQRLVGMMLVEWRWSPMGNGSAKVGVASPHTKAPSNRPPFPNANGRVMAISVTQPTPFVVPVNFCPHGQHSTTPHVIRLRMSGFNGPIRGRHHPLCPCQTRRSHPIRFKPPVRRSSHIPTPRPQNHNPAKAALPTHLHLCPFQTLRPRTHWPYSSQPPV